MAFNLPALVVAASQAPGQGSRVLQEADEFATREFHMESLSGGNLDVCGGGGLTSALVRRLQRVTGEQQPAEALISFARCMTGDIHLHAKSRGTSLVASFASLGTCVGDSTGSTAEPWAPPKGRRRPWEAAKKPPVPPLLMSSVSSVADLGLSPPLPSERQLRSRRSVVLEPVCSGVPSASPISTGSATARSLSGPMPPPWAPLSEPSAPRLVPVAPFSARASLAPRLGGHKRSASAHISERLLLERRARANFPSVRAYGPPAAPVDCLEREVPSALSGMASDGVSAEERVSAAVEKPGEGAEPEQGGSAAHDGAVLDETEADEQHTPVYIPWREAELRAVFMKFSSGDDREVRTEDLYSLLHYLGARPRQSVVGEIVVGMTRYASLSWQEFTDFLRRYREQDIKELRQQFDAADLDHNGCLDRQELHTLLLQLGYSPTGAVTREALAEIDSDKSGTVDFNEFEQLREHLRKTRGFLKEEARELKEIYMRANGGGDAEMPIDMVDRIRTYLGYTVPMDALDDILHTIDSDGSGALNFDELLQLVRCFQDWEFETMCSIIARFSEDKVAKVVLAFLEKRGWRHRRQATRNGYSVPPDAADQPNLAAHQKIQLRHIGAVLTEMGYFASEEVIEEILNRHFVQRAYPNALSMAEMCDFLRAYRLTEGFTSAQVRELQETFQREQAVSVAGDNDDTLDALELGRVLRWFGISQTLQQIRRLIDEVDFDGKQQLEFHEFVKLMRKFYQEEGKTVRKMFLTFRMSPGDCIHRASLSPLLKAISGGFVDEGAEARVLRCLDMEGNETLSREEFHRFFRAYRGALMESFRSHFGHGPSEVDRLRGIFNKYDREGIGALNDEQCRKLIEDYMPEAMLSVRGKEQMKAILADLPPPQPALMPQKHLPLPTDEAVNSEADSVSCDASVYSSSMPGPAASKSSSSTSRTHGKAKSRRAFRLDFHQFLALMRKAYDLRDERDIVREEEAIQECGYTAEEVEAFRQVFTSFVDSTGEILLDTLIDMLGKVRKVDAYDVEQFRQLLVRFNPERREVARFPQFLLLMKHILRQNMINLSEIASHAVANRAGRSSRNP